jgi:hypothetical protein
VSINYGSEADTKELLRRDTSAFRTAGQEPFQETMRGTKLLGEGVVAETVIGARGHFELVVFVLNVAGPRLSKGAERMRSH